MFQLMANDTNRAEYMHQDCLLEIHVFPLHHSPVTILTVIPAFCTFAIAAGTLNVRN